jgi:nucleoside-diphosphate-sugar epimerase
VLDVTRAAAELGWRPTTPLAEGLRGALAQE